MYRDIRRVKQELRQECLEFRRRMPAEEKAALDAAVLRRILAMPEFQRADAVFTYVGKPLETDTRGILEAAWKAGLPAAAPRCIPGTRNMEFLAAASEDDLVPGTFGVREPDPLRCRPLRPTERTFCVVPGLAFDPEGFRLGYGKGYYDRFLADFPGVSAGICFTGCIRRKLPRGRYDRPVDFLVTEQYVRRITGAFSGCREQENSR